jgi:hypothetical protein
MTSMTKRQLQRFARRVDRLRLAESCILERLIEAWCELRDRISNT